MVTLIVMALTLRTLLGGYWEHDVMVFTSMANCALPWVVPTTEVATVIVVFRTLLT